MALGKDMYDFTPADNSATFLQITGGDNLKIENKVFNGYFYNLDA